MKIIPTLSSNIPPELCSLTGVGLGVCLHVRCVRLWVIKSSLNLDYIFLFHGKYCQSFLCLRASDSCWESFHFNSLGIIIFSTPLLSHRAWRRLVARLTISLSLSSLSSFGAMRGKSFLFSENCRRVIENNMIEIRESFLETIFIRCRMLATFLWF